MHMNDRPTSEQSAGKVYRGYLSKKHYYLLPKYIKSMVGLSLSYLYIYYSQITLLQRKKWSSKSWYWLRLW